MINFGDVPVIGFRYGDIQAFKVFLGNVEIWSLLPPIDPDTYIWYKYGINGFITGDDNRRYIKDYGNTNIEIKSRKNSIKPNIYKNFKGIYKGTMYSGASVDLTPGGYIDVPVNFDPGAGTGNGSITYFDFSLYRFVQIDSNLFNDVTYRLENLKFNCLIVLYDRVFTQEDLDAMTQEPELAVRFGFGSNVLPSGIVKSVNDKVYPALETGPQLIEINSIHTAQKSPKDWVRPHNDYWELLESREGYLKIKKLRDSTSQNCLFASHEFPEVQNPRMVHCYKPSYNNACFFYRHWLGGDYADVIYYNNNAFSWGSKTIDYRSITTTTSTTNTDPSTNISFYCTSSSEEAPIGAIFEFNDIYLFDEQEHLLPINDDYIRVYNEPYGAQKLRFEMNDIGVPVKFLYTQEIKTDLSSSIDTGISINGNYTDFSIMLGFRLKNEITEKKRYIANTDENGESIISLFNSPENEYNNFTAIIGSETFHDIIFNDLPINAMCMIYSKNNQTVKFAIDGGTFSNEIPVDLNTTNNIIIGAKNLLGDEGFNSFILEGVMTAKQIQEIDWLNFWNKINNNNFDIRYTLNPDDGFYIERNIQDNVNKIKDSGVPGIYSGDIYSSNHISLDDTKYVRIPLDVNYSDIDEKREPWIGSDSWVKIGDFKYQGTNTNTCLCDICVASYSGGIKTTFIITEYVSGSIEGISENGTFTIETYSENLHPENFTGIIEIISVNIIESVNTKTVLFYDPIYKQFNYLLSPNYSTGLSSINLLDTIASSFDDPDPWGNPSTCAIIEDSKLKFNTSEYCMIALDFDYFRKFGCVRIDYLVDILDYVSGDEISLEYMFQSHLRDISGDGEIYISQPVIPPVDKVNGYRTSISVPGGSDQSFSVDNLKISALIPQNGFFDLNVPFSELLLLNKEITQNDIDYLNSNPNAIRDIYTQRKTHPLSFTREDILEGSYYPIRNQDSSNFIQTHVSRSFNKKYLCDIKNFEEVPINVTFSDNQNLVIDNNDNTATYISDGSYVGYNYVNANFDIATEPGYTYIVQLFFKLISGEGMNGYNDLSFSGHSINASSCICSYNDDVLAEFYISTKDIVPEENPTYRVQSNIEKSFEYLIIPKLYRIYTGIDTYNRSQLPYITDEADSYLLNKNFGCVDIFYKKNDFGIIISSTEDNHQIQFNGSGSSVDTDIQVDGTVSNFSMMLSFTDPELDEKYNIKRNQLIVGPWTPDTENGLHILYNHETYKYQIKIGKSAFTIDINNSNPIHAMCAIYNKDTQKVQVGLDGGPLQEIDVVFDGITQSVILGNNNIDSLDAFKGKIGEGVFISQLLTESQWLDFWEKVKNGKPSKIS